MRVKIRLYAIRTILSSFKENENSPTNMLLVTLCLFAIGVSEDEIVSAAELTEANTNFYECSKGLLEHAKLLNYKKRMPDFSKLN